MVNNTIIKLFIEYQYVADILSKPCDRSATNPERALLKLFLPTVGQQLNPEDLIPYLLQDGAIDHYDQEEILSTLRYSGRIAASLTLLDRMQRRLSPKNWFRSFSNALVACDRHDLVDIIDPYEAQNMCTKGNFIKLHRIY